MPQNFALRVQKPTFKSVVRQVMRRNLPTNQFIFPMDGFLSMLLEDFKCTMREEFQHIVRQEFERRVQPLLLQLQRPSLSPVEASSTETWLQLQFLNSPSGPLFSHNKLKCKDGSPIMVELLDTVTNKRITSEHPLSSSKVEIVVLKGDFHQEVWNAQEFAMNILSERENSGKLLTGDLKVILREGLGVIENLVVTDSSHWTGNRRFRLGAVLVTSCSSWPKVKQAKSEAFVVKSGRSKPNEKHYPPSPQSEIWRLENISKTGRICASLRAMEICYVRDFLCEHWKNPAGLLEELRKTGLSVLDNFWKIVVTHALTCELDENLYFVYNDIAHGVGLLFNSRCELIEASVDEQGFRPLNLLTPPQRKLVDALMIQAYTVKSWLQIDKLAYAELPRQLTSDQDEPSSMQFLGTEQSDLFPDQAQVKGLVSTNDHLVAASAEIFSASGLIHFSGTEEENNSWIGDMHMICNGGTSSSSSRLQDGIEPMMSNSYFTVMNETDIPLSAATHTPVPLQFNNQTEPIQSHAPALRPDKILESLYSSSCILDPVHKFFPEALRKSFRFTEASSSADHGGDWPCSTKEQPFGKSLSGSLSFISRCSNM